MRKNTRRALNRLDREVIQFRQQGQYEKAISLATQICELIRS